MFERRSTPSFKGEIGPGLDHFSNCFMFLHQSNKFQVLQVPMKKVYLNSEFIKVIRKQGLVTLVERSDVG